jgi:hypothetical protein
MGDLSEPPQSLSVVKRLDLIERLDKILPTSVFFEDAIFSKFSQIILTSLAMLATASLLRRKKVSRQRLEESPEILATVPILR